jgi:hypothetical protein
MPLMVIEAAGCLKTYQKSAAGHECTSLVMDKYSEVPTHTDAIETTIFPAIMGRFQAAPVVRGVFLLGPTSCLPIINSNSLTCSVSPAAESFWKVPFVDVLVFRWYP